MTPSATTISETTNRCWCGRLEAVASAADRGDKGSLVAAVELAPEVADVDVHNIGPGVEGIVPDGGEDLLSGEYLARVTHEVLEERELAGGELDLLLPAQDAPAEKVHLQITGLQPGRPGLVGPADEGAHPGQELLKGERLGHVVVGAAVEGADLVAYVVAGGEHQDRQPGAPEPYPLQNLLTAQARQHDVQQHKIHILLDREARAIVAVVGADAAVAVGRQAPLQHPHDARLVFYDQNAHMSGSIIQPPKHVVSGARRVFGKGEA